ncbi:uracil DNA glycosylase [Sorochytrium milnesiophthora]
MLQSWLQTSASKTGKSAAAAKAVAGAVSTKTASGIATQPAADDAAAPSDNAALALKQTKAVESLRTLGYLDLELRSIHPSWLRVLADDLKKPYFKQLKAFLDKEAAAGKTVYPPSEDIYTWAASPFDTTKVVIIGQDPYHGPGQAHGLSFSVRPGVAVPPSLNNMYTELRNEFPGTFAPPANPRHGYLQGWANQGVLLLNAVLTVRKSEANSHAKQGWEQFTDAVIRELNTRKRGLVFMLWGSHAQKKGERIDKTRHLVLKSAHPSPLSAHKGFLGNGHFRAANEYLEQNGGVAIDWSRLPVDEEKGAGSRDHPQDNGTTAAAGVENSQQVVLVPAKHGRPAEGDEDEPGNKQPKVEQ